jgi:PKHD-type hydroxylase
VTPSHELHRFVSIPAVFTPAECDAIISLAQAEQSSKGEVLSTTKGSALSMVRRCDVTWLPLNPSTKWVYERLWQATTAQNTKTWGFQLDVLKSLQYLHYGALNWYARHVDCGSPPVATRKLTVSLQLSDPTHFVGGKLRIWGEQPERHASDAQGSITIFPSYLWHQANPVWWGHRRALIAWFEGRQPLR